MKDIPRWKNVMKYLYFFSKILFFKEAQYIKYQNCFASLSSFTPTISGKKRTSIHTYSHILPGTGTHQVVLVRRRQEKYRESGSTETTRGRKKIGKRDRKPTTSCLSFTFCKRMVAKILLLQLLLDVELRKSGLLHVATSVG